MQQEELGLGSIKIHQAVIAQIAAEATREIEGVSKLTENFKDELRRLLGRETAAGVRVSIDADNKVKVRVHVIIKYGYNIPDVASKIQESVRAALERMTNAAITSINVRIQGVERGKS